MLNICGHSVSYLRFARNVKLLVAEKSQSFGSTEVLLGFTPYSDNESLQCLGHIFVVRASVKILLHFSLGIHPCQGALYIFAHHPFLNCQKNIVKKYYTVHNHKNLPKITVQYQKPVAKSLKFY